MRKHKWFGKAKGETKGQALLESLLILIIFCFVMFATMDLGQFFYFSSTLQSRLEAGARYAAVYGCGNTNAATCPNAVMVAIYGNPEGTGSSFLLHPELISGSVITRVHDKATLAEVMVVSANNYPVPLIFFSGVTRKKVSVGIPTEKIRYY